MKRSLFSLVAGCLAALVINGFTARPLMGAVLHQPAGECTVSQASGPGSKAQAHAFVESRKASFRAKTCKATVVPPLAFLAAGR